jgi:lipid A 3-O-deacylase
VVSAKFRIALAAMIALPSVVPRAAPPSDPFAILTVQEENATISANSPTDRFYTNGSRLEWTSPTGQVPGLLGGLGRALWGEGQQRVGIGLSQQIYTPEDTDADPAKPYDRPYAGYLTTNFTLLSDTDTTRSVLMVSLGVVGPAAGGEPIQNWVHSLIGQSHDQGWGSQIPNTAAFELSHDRTWRLAIGSLGGLETDALPSLTVGVGNVRDYVQLGGTVRIGQGLGSDFGVPRVRPGLSGGDAYTPTQPFTWYLFAGVDGQAVGYDLLLQSSPFRGGPHVDLTWDIAEFQAGVAIMAYGIRLSVAYVGQTQEFEGQRGGLHQFGSVSLAMRF